MLNCQIYVGNEKLDFPPFSLHDAEKEKNNKMKDEIKDIILFKNFVGICSNIIIYKEKRMKAFLNFCFLFLKIVNKDLH